jgi:DNA invertase Pin-like site-specific DNA recombinase
MMEADVAEKSITPPRLAAAYMRMSKDVQNYSIEHQLDRIRAYAAAGGLAIVRTFVDAGISGLKADNRPGLLAMLAEVTGKACEFSVIVVYDVSRWGRFQDVDESAYYEFLCRRAGVLVVYCAEQFGQDGAPMSAVLKGLKRIMAAEFSRELGVKVLLAQSRFSHMGYKQGGKAGYGLRRVPVSVEGQVRGAMQAGERKSVATDRVALMHGPTEEVDTVRRVYRLYTEEEFGDSDIAALLRSEHSLTHEGKYWTASAVRRILTNSRYCGELLFNQTTRRMGGRVSANPEALWIRCKSALQPMVDRALFEKARSIRAVRAAGPQRAAVLEQLRELYRKNGNINIALCRQDPSLPGKQTMLALFGGYVQAYTAAGIPPLHTSRGALGMRTVRALIDAMVADVQRNVVRAGAVAVGTHIWNVLKLNDALTLKVTIASCRHCSDGWTGWRLPLRQGDRPDFVLCGLMDCTNEHVGCYLLLRPGLFDQATLYLSERGLVRHAANRFATLEEIFGLQPTRKATDS